MWNCLFSTATTNKCLATRLCKAVNLPCEPHPNSNLISLSLICHKLPIMHQSTAKKLLAEQIVNSSNMFSHYKSSIHSYYNEECCSVEWSNYKQWWSRVQKRSPIESVNSPGETLSLYLWDNLLHLCWTMPKRWISSKHGGSARYGARLCTVCAAQ